ncbi:MAG: DUF1559 domain-containing protein, partial [Thermoguttaceae bacterium]|nr:DUF1559 domain-containing protein [Thermoguttaceae bacterium]
HSRTLYISKETTYITEPLKSDGKQVDYFAALRQATYPPNIATDDNGYRLIIEHLGKAPDTTPSEFASICGQLGLDAAAIRPAKKYQAPDDFLRAYAEGPEFDKSLLKALPRDRRSSEEVPEMLESKLAWPWTLNELPMMAAWLEENGPALDLIGEAVRKLIFHMPLALQSEGELLSCESWREMLRMRAFGQGLSVRANYRIAAGDLDGAIDDVVACNRLGRHVGRGTFHTDLLAGISLEGTAQSIGIAGSLEHPLTKERLERLLAELDCLPPPGTLRDKALAERFSGLDAIQGFACNKALREEYLGYYAADPWLHSATRAGVDWNVTAIRFNELFDDHLATGNVPSYRPFTLSFAASLLSKRARSGYLAEIVFWQRDSYDMIIGRTRRGDCCRQMQRITLAMLGYELDHGTLPPAWTVDAEGNPLHSWRVLLLPYLGHQVIYEQIRLDEPWDSEHNRQFHGEDLAVYRCPSDPVAGPGQTTYSVVVGPDVAFQPGQGKRLADFGPHSDDLILLVERMEPVGWMDPGQEITQADADKGMLAMGVAPSVTTGRIGSHHLHAHSFGFRNGAVRSLSWDVTDYASFNNSEKAMLEWFQRLLRGANADKSCAW